MSLRDGLGEDGRRKWNKKAALEQAENKHHKMWNDMKVPLPHSQRKNLQARETKHQREKNKRSDVKSKSKSRSRSRTPPPKPEIGAHRKGKGDRSVSNRSISELDAMIKKLEAEKRMKEKLLK